MSVRLEVADHVATVTIDRPEVMNAIDLAAEAELQRIWTALEADDGVRLVVLTGAVWDRAEGRFVALGISPPGSDARPSLQGATGNFLMIAHSLTQDWQAPFMVSVYDATRLPILTS